MFKITKEWLKSRDACIQGMNKFDEVCHTISKKLKKPRTYLTILEVETYAKHYIGWLIDRFQKDDLLEDILDASYNKYPILMNHIISIFIHDRKSNIDSILPILSKIDIITITADCCGKDSFLSMYEENQTSIKRLKILIPYLNKIDWYIYDKYNSDHRISDAISAINKTKLLTKKEKKTLIDWYLKDVDTEVLKQIKGGK